MIKYKIPLADVSFTDSEWSELENFIKNRERWTQGKYVREFESIVKEKLNTPYPVMVSSGSTANTLVAMWFRYKYPNAKKIILPALTWTTTASPFILMGFEPIFIDVNLDNFSYDVDKLKEVVDSLDEEVCIAIVSILGLTPDMDKLNEIINRKNVHAFMDNCESMMSEFKGANINTLMLSTTSTYFAHEITSIEGGIVFAENEEQYEYFLMARNHGMIRDVPNKDKYRNSLIDERFDFAVLGNNFRNTEFNALVGVLNMKRYEEFRDKREELSQLYYRRMRSTFMTCPKFPRETREIFYGFPIIATSPEHKKEIERKLIKYDIEYRPLISGNLLRHTAYLEYRRDFKNADYLHENGMYIGCYPNMNVDTLDQFLKSL